MIALAAERANRTVTLDVADEQVAFDWGLSHELGSAAYWVEQARRSPSPARSFQLGGSLAEEVVACLLGGFGMPAAVALAAFERLRCEIDLEGRVEQEAIERVLCEPVLVAGCSRPRRYRFPRQRATRIAAALARLRKEQAPLEPLALRDWLLDFHGIGPKTASWIVRNHTGSDAVAIIDIHISRAGTAAGFFSPGWSLPRDYLLFEGAFLAVAKMGDVSAAQLDAHMWFELQRLGAAAAIIYGTRLDR